MRILALTLLLAACSAEELPKSAGLATYAGQGRDRLCTRGDRAGFITYGTNDANCSAQGRLDRAGEHRLTFVPTGDQDCRIAVEEQGATLRLGKASAACAYYCGPGASFDGKSFAKSPSASPAVDFAGDPLC
jgi:hypothetical protein